MTAAQFRDLNRQAVQGGLSLVRKARTEDLNRPTPCAGWTLADLLAHMTAQHRGFAAAAAGRGGDLAIWDETGRAADPLADYAAAAEEVIAAFAADGATERQFALPTITTDFEIPAAQAMSFHFVDYVVHGWDVARTLDLPYEPDPELLGPALKVAELVPDNETRLAPGAAFAPALPVDDDTATLDRILLLLGRRPDWSA